MPAAPRASRRDRREGDPLCIAVCIDTRDGPGRERLRGVYERALRRRWRLILVRQEGRAAEKRLSAERLDGAILYDRTAAFHTYFRRRRVPCVETGACNLRLSDAAVFSDDRSLGRAGAEHLVSAGFRHFAYCGLVHTHPSKRRARFFGEALGRHGFRIAAFEDSQADGEMAMGPLIRWLRRLPKPVGLLAYDDKLAERVLAACRWSALPVPDEVGVLGLGNDEVICELSDPRLSSIGVPAREMGHKATELLMSLLSGRRRGKLFLEMPCKEVVVRASTDWMPPAHPSVKAAVEMIRASLHQPLGTDQIAAAVGAPRRTLERRFKSAMGKTVHDYLLDLRLRLAKELLQQPALTLGEVARRCGYSALSAFCAMFTARHGCHPRVYRERLRGG